MNAVKRTLVIAMLASAAACTAILGATDVPDQAEGGAGTDATMAADSGRGDAGGASCDVGTCVVTYAGQVMADHPLAYWRLDEPSGSAVAIDMTGNYPGAYHGEVAFGQQGAIASDPSSSAIWLNSTGEGNGYVSVPSPFASLSQFPNMEPYTLEVWIKPTKVDGQYRAVLSNSIEAGAGKEGYNLYVGGFTSNGTGLGFDRFDIGTSTPVHDAGAVSVNGSWYHVVVVYGGSQDSVITIYVNGGVAAQSNTLLDQQSFAGCTFDIGTNLCGTGGFFQGYVDEVAVYATALDAGTIHAHYAAAGDP
jgi:hypothetical protein